MTATYNNSFSMYIQERRIANNSNFYLNIWDLLIKLFGK